MPMAKIISDGKNPKIPLAAKTNVMANLRLRQNPHLPFLLLEAA